MREARPRFGVSPDRGAELALAFYLASRNGDVTALRQLLPEDVVIYSDDGRKSSSATRPIVAIYSVQSPDKLKRLRVAT